MFELSVALKYLIPRRRQLSVSIIALLSVLVISLVVWLVVVFLSVTHGIERRWIGTLTAINAPVRLTPTDEYFQSYYYLADAHSCSADYMTRTISEKLEALESDPYDPTFDAELPATVPAADRLADGTLKDPVKGAFAIMDGISGVNARDYEAALGSLRLRVLRAHKNMATAPLSHHQRFVSQVCYFGTFDEENGDLAKTLMPVTNEDLTQYLDVVSLSGDNAREESPSHSSALSPVVTRERIQAFFQNVDVQKLKPVAGGWIVPPSFYPKEGSVAVELSDHYAVIKKDGSEQITFSEAGFSGLEGISTLVVEDSTLMEASLDQDSLKTARQSADLQFDLNFKLQGLLFAGKTGYRHLEFAEADVAEVSTTAPPWVHRSEASSVLPADGLLLPVAFRKQDVRVGDQGYISYYAGSPSSIEEQRIPVYVSGFYDPGLTPTGSRLVLVNRDIISDMRGATAQIDSNQANGIGVWFDDVYRADTVKQQIVAGLEERGIAPYWKVETYKEYEFAKPLLDQFQSDRLLFSLIAVIIILVACSNIISMLILLVNDKRQEIGILRAMGAKPRSIAAIFGFCGASMGIFGSAVGIIGALFTLRHLDRLIGLLSAIQGHDAFNAQFFGGDMPSQLSYSVLTFVVGATVVISLAAGLIPAIKAARLRPSTILRSQ